MPDRKKFTESLRIPNFVDLRAMKLGESRVFAIGSSVTQLGSVTSKIGGNFAQRSVLLVDPVNATTNKVLLVTCLKPVPHRTENNHACNLPN